LEIANLRFQTGKSQEGRKGWRAHPAGIEDCKLQISEVQEPRRTKGPSVHACRRFKIADFIGIHKQQGTRQRRAIANGRLPTDNGQLTTDD
jgi:hypothetical protein